MAEEVATTDGKRTITLDECKAHTSDKDCWLVIHGKVYDVTEFLDEHPGGFDIIVSNSGEQSGVDSLTVMRIQAEWRCTHHRRTMQKL